MIVVLRLGHRLVRDERITTHVALLSRAFGASEIIYTGDKDQSMENSVFEVVKNWGGAFTISYRKNGISVIEYYKKRGFAIVHLTMYGIPLPEKLKEIKRKKNILVVVGGSKVPSEVYHLADFNTAITSQPHSEVGALAICLDRLMGGKELESNFDRHFKGKIKIEPSENGKIIKKRGC